MKPRSVLFSALVVALLATASISFVYANGDDNFVKDGVNYSKTSDTTVQVISYSYSGDVTIPSKVTDGSNTYDVTAIGSRAFFRCSYLTSVTFPDSLKKIGSMAFYGCSRLASLTLPDGVKEIGEWAFYGCIRIPSVEIPDSVTTLGYRAFCLCTGIETVTLGEGLAKIGYSAFQSCVGIESITIPDNISEIGDYAFYRCTGLESVTIPDSVTSIGEYAFAYCTKLASATLGDGLSVLRDSAFCNCTNLSTVTLGKNTTLGEDPFTRCTGLKKIIAPSDSTQYSDIDGVLFSKDRSGLIRCPEGREGSYVIPDGTQVIGKNAFDECSKLTSVTIPSTVASVTDNPFGRCANLTEIKVNAGNLHFSSAEGILFSKDGSALRAYPEGKTASTYAIPSTVAKIGTQAFVGCTCLTSLTIPNTVEEIGSYAFSGCANLTSVTIPCTTTVMGHAFEGLRFYDVDGKTIVADGDLPGFTYTGESAKLVRQCNVFFDENGGSVSIGAMGVKGGDRFTLPYYGGTKSGHTFGGWSYGGRTYAPGTEMTKAEGDMVFVAVWNIITYEAVFMNGDEIFYTATYEYGSTIVAPTDVPTKKSTDDVGYIFNSRSGYREGMVITGNVTFHATYDAVVKKIDMSGEVNVIDMHDSDMATISSEIIEMMRTSGKDTSIVTSKGTVVIDSASAASLSGKQDISFVYSDRSKIPESILSKIGDRPIYDITFGNVHEFGGTLTISAKYTLKSGESADDVCIWYLKDNGTYEKIPCSYSDGYATFQTSHLSNFAVMVESSPEPSSGGDNTVLIVVIAVVALVVIGGAAFYLFTARKHRTPRWGTIEKLKTVASGPLRGSFSHLGKTPIQESRMITC